MVNARMKTLKKQIQKITNLMISLKAKSPVLDEAVKLITDTKGVGDNSALSLLVAMPELGKIPKEQAAPLSGLAPNTIQY